MLDLVAGRCQGPGIPAPVAGELGSRSGGVGRSPVDGREYVAHGVRAEIRPPAGSPPPLALTDGTRSRIIGSTSDSSRRNRCPTKSGAVKRGPSYDFVSHSGAEGDGVRSDRLPRSPLSVTDPSGPVPRGRPGRSRPGGTAGAVEGSQPDQSIRYGWSGGQQPTIRSASPNRSAGPPSRAGPFRRAPAPRPASGRPGPRRASPAIAR